ncbi:glycosyltransferase family 2 protein [Antarcticibacterium arcticum]|uniref:Glycosyltransferase family 2 protein n=1 Tax=Antarcticibacterium arcticum TaxID=2585771 RepID=A0A5B8YIT6_9FLAO|nr:glycosyltransferase family 2 protein [Antarcticibacterium arcticum]QED36533.1 glycosyltransferase family 2 protein [Antarcticibacterium arcticum]
MNFNQFKEKYQKFEVEEFPNKVTYSPLVSVLVQTYNHENYIRECLDSILYQKTDFDFEILLGEDYSTDTTREICKDYAEKNPENIRLFLHHPDNKIIINGVSTGNFNAFYNFYKAQGKYIAFCEGDDRWRDPFKLQKHINSFKTNFRLVMNYHSYITVDHNSNLFQTYQMKLQPIGNISGTQLLEGKFHPLLSTTCFKKVFNEIPLEMTQVMNVDTFLISLLGNFGDAIYLKNIFPSAYRIHKGGMWSLKEKKQKYLSKILTFTKLEEFYLSQGNKRLSQFYRDKKANTFKMAAVFYFLNLNFFQFIQNVWNYIKTKFFNLKFL